jgi:hypothetical protein
MNRCQVIDHYWWILLCLSTSPNASTQWHAQYPRCHQSTIITNCRYQRSQFRASVIYSSFSQLFSVRNCLKWDPPFPRSSKNTITLRHTQSTTYAVVMLWKIRLNTNFVQVEIDYRPQFCELYVKKRESGWNPHPNVMEPERPQHDRPEACVIAQQYTFPLSHFLSRKEKFGARFTIFTI